MPERGVVMKKRKLASDIIYHILMIVFCVIMLYPLIWMIVSSLKPSHEVMRTATSLIVKNPTLDNYVEGWKGFARYSFTIFFKNSLFLCFVRVAGTVISASITAYAFARIPFMGRKIWFGVMIVTMCLPVMVLQVPQYIMFNNMGWIGTWAPILIPCWFGGGAFNIFLIMQFMRNIPKEIDEAAKIDGCGWFGLYRQIMLPLVKPALGSVAILSFIEAWGDFYSALVYLNKPQYYPVAYALKLFSDETSSSNYGPMLAMSVCALIPILILFFIFQKTLVEGISTSGIKG